MMLGLLGILVIGTAFFQEKLESINERKLFRILCGVYSVLALYLIMNVDNVLRADADTVHKAAADFNAGNYYFFQPGEYLYRFHHQHGIVFYEHILLKFSENPAFLFLVNFFLVLGINHTSWKISEEIFHDRLANVLTILVCFAFLPQLFFILFAYGLIPGLFFMLRGFLHTFRFVRDDRWQDMIAMAAFVAMAIIVKQNCLIGAIAIIIYLFLQILRKKNVRCMAAVLVLTVCMVLPGKLICRYYSTKSGVTLDNPSPSILWLAMGTDLDNKVYGPGWYDHSVWILYDEAEYDSDRAFDLAVNKLNDNWDKIQADPVRAIKFFGKKAMTIWCDPLYQSVWSGPMLENGQQTHTPFLQSIYTNGAWEDRLVMVCKWITLSIWLFAVLFLCSHAGKQEGWDLIYLYFLGGFLFHLLWEGKSQYSYPYIFCLIPFAAYAFRMLLAKMKQVRKVA